MFKMLNKRKRHLLESICSRLFFAKHRSSVAQKQLVNGEAGDID
jgi:hypothetical protein